MATATLTAVNGGGAVHYSDGNVLDYAVADSYCVKVRKSGIDRDIQSVNSPGVDGGGTKDYGYRGQEIRLEVVYVRGSEADCDAAWQADAAIFAAVCTVVANGVTYNACILQHGTDADQAKSTGVAATYRMDAVIVLRATRP